MLQTVSTGLLGILSFKLKFQRGSDHELVIKETAFFKNRYDVGFHPETIRFFFSQWIKGFIFAF